MMVKVETAAQQDAPGILALRRALEAWLHARGVKQWGPGEVAAEDVQRQTAAGEWHVVRSASCEVVAALRLLWSDEPVWQWDNAEGAYVHGLMVSRGQAGQGVGEALLGWAVEQARAARVPVLRLDYVESNAALRGYYRRLGFTEVGRRDFEGHWHSATLLEMALPVDQ